MTDRAIDHGCTVTLQFALELPDGNVIDSNFEGAPATFRMGDGTLLEGFEAALLGLGAGDEEQFRIPAARAFGPWREENVQQFARHRFTGMSLEPGAVVSFADASGAELPGVVQGVEGDTVVVDFNHPLAGRDLVFRVRIHGVA